MKFDVYDMGKVYKDYFTIQQNQINILQQMRAEIIGYVELESFKGDAATNAKSYMTDIHISIVDSFDIALMEMEIRLLTLKQDFNAAVDSDTNAILNSVYISQVADDLSGHITNASDKEQPVERLISSVSDIVPLSKPPIQDYSDKLRVAKENAQDTVQKMHEFESRHASDMENINEMLSAIRSAMSYIGDVGGISDYEPQSAAETDWSQQLFACQVKSYFFAIAADPDFYDTVYLDFALQTGLTMLEALLPPDADMSVIKDYLDSGKDIADYISITKDITKSSQEAIQIIRFFTNGIRFIPSANANGEAIIRAVTLSGKTLSRSQQVIAMRSAGVGEDLMRGMARGLAEKLFSAKGLEASALQNGTIDAKSVAALTAAVNAGADSNSFMKAFAKELKGVSALEWALFGVTIAIDAADAFYDERTRQFSSNFDGVHFAANAAVDSIAFLTPIAAVAAAGAAFGTVVPGIGNIVGAAVGVIVGCATLIKWGEPPRSLTDRASDWLEGAIHDAGNWLSKVFW